MILIYRYQHRNVWASIPKHQLFSTDLTHPFQVFVGKNSTDDRKRDLLMFNADHNKSKLVSFLANNPGEEMSVNINFSSIVPRMAEGDKEGGLLDYVCQYALQLNMDQEIRLLDESTCSPQSSSFSLKAFLLKHLLYFLILLLSLLVLFLFCLLKRVRKIESQYKKKEGHSIAIDESIDRGRRKQKGLAEGDYGSFEYEEEESRDRKKEEVRERVSKERPTKPNSTLDGIKEIDNSNFFDENDDSILEVNPSNRSQHSMYTNKNSQHGAPSTFTK